MIIAIDFDGTCVTHEFPKVGQEIGAVAVLKALTENGHQLILNTMRSGQNLKPAVDWFKDNGIPLLAVNENPNQKKWTTSSKTYAELYIDDANLGAPLLFDEHISKRPFINWVKVLQYCVDRGLIPFEMVDALVVAIRETFKRLNFK